MDQQEQQQPEETSNSNLVCSSRLIGEAKPEGALEATKQQRVGD